MQQFLNNIHGNIGIKQDLGLGSIMENMNLDQRDFHFGFVVYLKTWKSMSGFDLNGLVAMED